MYVPLQACPGKQHSGGDHCPPGCHPHRIKQLEQNRLVGVGDSLVLHAGSNHMNERTTFSSLYIIYFQRAYTVLY